MAIFPTVFFRQYRPGKCVLLYARKKKPFQTRKTRSSNSRKIDICSKVLTHGFGQKMAIFSTLFQGVQARKMCFVIFQNEKTPLQAEKTTSSKSRKIDFFLKGLAHGFGLKTTILKRFFQAIQAKKISYEILERKNAFLVIKTRSLKSRKIDIFPKGLTHGFCPKMAIFPSVFVQAIQARKRSFMIFQNEIREESVC